MLFASLDAEIYRQMGTHEHLMADGTMAAAAGEDDGGPTLFKLVVIDPSGNVVCTAERPAPPPGWQRDPRMACFLPALLTRQTPVYRLRVELKAPEGEHMVQPYYPFLLNVSLRRVASTRLVVNGIAALTAGRTLDQVKARYFQDWSVDERAKAEDRA